VLCNKGTKKNSEGNSSDAIIKRQARRRRRRKVFRKASEQMERFYFVIFIRTRPTCSIQSSAAD
jgi:hypothetical protein